MKGNKCGDKKSKDQMLKESRITLLLFSKFLWDDRKERERPQVLILLAPVLIFVLAGRPVVGGMGSPSRNGPWHQLLFLPAQVFLHRLTHSRTARDSVKYTIL